MPDAIKPLRIESSPNEGPTRRSSTILTGAFKAPAFSTISNNLLDYPYR